MPSLYALLVGINNYPSPVSRLSGCINDIEAMANYLQERVTQERELHLRVLKNDEATREAVIQGFREHLVQAKEGDSVLFMFCGHGSQEQAPPEFWHIEPDHLNETLVCWDSRLPGRWDLADKELAKLIAEVAGRNPQITVILDCCHSGSASRDLEGVDFDTTRPEPDVLRSGFRSPVREVSRSPVGDRNLADDRDLKGLYKERYTRPDQRQRPIETYCWEISTTRSDTPASRFEVPCGRHILLAACRDKETAKENSVQQRGAFSYFLMEALQATTSPLSYRDLFKRTHALIRGQVPEQSPQLEASTHAEDLDMSFLHGTRLSRQTVFTLSHDRKLGWVIDGGTIHGISATEETDTIQLAVFPFDATSKVLAQADHVLGKVEVKAVLPQQSQVRWIDTELSTQQTFKAIVVRSPLSRIGVVLDGDPDGVEAIRSALRFANGNSAPSLYVQEVDADSPTVRLRVLAINGRYRMAVQGSQLALVAKGNEFNYAIAQEVVRRLEHIACWFTTMELRPPASAQIPANAVQVQVYNRDGEEMKDVPIRLSYFNKEGQWKKPTFKFKLINIWNRPLYCTVLDLTERYAVNGGFLEAGGVWLQPGEEAWAMGGRALSTSVPDQLWEKGITTCQEVLKVIACTQEFDARLLEQGEVENIQYDVTRSDASRSALKRLMQHMQPRTITLAEEEEEESNDLWLTQEITLVTERSLRAR